MTGTANCFTPTFVAEILPPKRSFAASAFCSGTKIANEVLCARSRNPNLRTELFELERFVTELERGGNNFAGEAIRRKDGTLEYLKLYRLNRSQTRRLYLLSTLAKVHWNFSAAAEVLHFEDKDEVAQALIEADLGYLLNPGLYGHLMR